MEVKDFVEAVVALSIPICIVAIATWNAKLGKGVGPKTIQLTGLLMASASIIILSLEKILDGSTVGTLIGGLIGYLLSGISNYDKPKGEGSS